MQWFRRLHPVHKVLLGFLLYGLAAYALLIWRVPWRHLADVIAQEANAVKAKAAREAER